MANTATKTAIEWAYPFGPTGNPRQIALAECPAQEILYGGAAGGGKTDSLLAACVMTCLLIPGAKVIIFRRTYKQLELEIIPRLQKNLPGFIAKYDKGEHVYTFHHNGATLWLSYLQTDKDLENYQGAEFHLVCFDELTQFTEKQYRYMRSRNRAAGDVQVAMAEHGWIPRMIATTNPGGPGHGWVKRMFVDPAAGLPRDAVFLGGLDEGEDPDGLRYLSYIPARSTDNPYLDRRAYNRQLGGLDPVLRRALKDGDWDILDGVRFPQFRRAIHVIEPEQLPIPMADYPRGVGVDWGITAPFCALWGALVPTPGDEPILVIYRELYSKNLTSDQQVELILEVEAPGERMEGRPLPVALDPSCWRRADRLSEPVTDPDLPPVGSIAWKYRKKLGGALRKAVNARIDGWALLDDLLRVRADGLPRILIYSTCGNLIRTLPEQLRDKHRPEDVDTSGDDHAADAVRYLAQLMVRGGVKRLPAETGAYRAAGLQTADAARDFTHDSRLTERRAPVSPAQAARLAAAATGVRMSTPGRAGLTDH